MWIESMLQSAKDKLAGLTPNDILKVVGLQLLQKSGRRIAPGWPLLAAFGGGLALGATSALLLAPKSGKETRKALADWVEAAFSNVKHGAETLTEGGDGADAAEGPDARRKNGRTKGLARDIVS